MSDSIYSTQWREAHSHLRTLIDTYLKKVTSKNGFSHLSCDRSSTLTTCTFCKSSKPSSFRIYSEASGQSAWTNSLLKHKNRTSFHPKTTSTPLICTSPSWDSSPSCSYLPSQQALAKTSTQKSFNSTQPIPSLLQSQKSTSTSYVNNQASDKAHPYTFNKKSHIINPLTFPPLLYFCNHNLVFYIVGIRNVGNLNMLSHLSYRFLSLTLIVCFEVTLGGWITFVIMIYLLVSSVFFIFKTLKRYIHTMSDSFGKKINEIILSIDHPFLIPVNSFCLKFPPRNYRWNEFLWIITEECAVLNVDYPISSILSLA